MTALRGPRTYYGSRFEPGIAATITFFVIFFGGMIFGFSAAVNDDSVTKQHQVETDRTQLVEMIDRQTGTGRQAVADSVLWEYSHHEDGALNTVFGTTGTAQLVRQIEHTAQTGQPVVYQPHMADWSDWRATWLTWTFPLMGLVISAVWFLTYAFHTADNNEFLMDLPWKRIWPVIFVVLTALPIGWPFYIVSAIQTHRARKRQAEERRRDAERRANHPQPVEAEDPYEDDLYDDPYPPRYRDEPDKPFVFHPAPGIARELYVQLRSGFWASRLASQRERISRDLEEVNVNLRELGEELKEEQRRRGTLMAQQRELESVQPNEELEASHLEKEFEQLLALPGVEGIRVVSGNRISLFVKVRPTFDGQTYDFGDWELRFGGDDAYLLAKRVRSGVKSDWGQSYPVYLSGGERFCFGYRENTINEHMRKGQFLQAVDIAIDSMHSVNPEHRSDLPNAYRLAEV